jgi:hypothetical protein
MDEEQRLKLKEEAKADIRSEFTEKYFLIPRNAWWAFLGGALAFAIAVGAISYKSAVAAISEPAVKAAQQKIFDAEKTATSAAGTVTAVADRINAGKLRFQKKCVDRASNNCHPVLPPCDSGFVDAGFTEDNTWKGGECGEGHLCRVCYQFAAK